MRPTSNQCLTIINITIMINVDNDVVNRLQEHVNIKAHPKLNPNLNPKRLGFRVRV